MAANSSGETPATGSAPFAVNRMACGFATSWLPGTTSTGTPRASSPPSSAGGQLVRGALPVPREIAAHEEEVRALGRDVRERLFEDLAALGVQLRARGERPVEGRAGGARRRRRTGGGRRSPRSGRPGNRRRAPVTRPRGPWSRIPRAAPRARARRAAHAFAPLHDRSHVLPLPCRPAPMSATLRANGARSFSGAPLVVKDAEPRGPPGRSECAGSSGTRVRARTPRCSSRASSGSSTGATTPGASPWPATTRSRCCAGSAGSARRRRRDLDGRGVPRGHRAHPLGHPRRPDGGATRTRTSTAPAASPWCTTASSRTTRRCGRACSGLGHVFASETDTEVIPHLIEEMLKTEPDFGAAFLAAMRLLVGAFGIAVVHADRSRPALWVARLGSPMVLGLGKGRTLVASDPAPARGAHARGDLPRRRRDRRPHAPTGSRPAPSRAAR